MPKARRTLPVTKLDTVARQILSDLLAAFLEQKLGADALQNGYVGVSLPKLIQRYCDSGTVLQVDFDLAIKQLEDNKLIGTGPMVPYENTPGSSVLILTIYSKREYCYLTEEGYRAARASPLAFERF